MTPEGYESGNAQRFQQWRNYRGAQGRPMGAAPTGMEHKIVLN